MEVPVDESVGGTLSSETTSNDQLKHVMLDTVMIEVHSARFGTLWAKFKGLCQQNAHSTNGTADPAA